MPKTNSIRRVALAVAIGVLTAGIYSASVSVADDTNAPQPLLDEAAAAEFPQPIFDDIADRITHQTSFAEIGPDGMIRWWPKTIELVAFVKSPSPDDPDTGLIAMRYEVTVLSEEHSLIVHRTSCQVVVVFKHGTYDQPLVVCEPVNLNRSVEAL